MTLTSQGFIPAKAEDLLKQVQQIFVNAFGSELDITNASTPQALLIQEITNLLVEVNDAKALLYSQLYNPELAPGVFLDGLCKFNGISRHPALASTVKVTITGAAGTLIPAGTKIMNTNNDIFYNPSPATLPSSVPTGQLSQLEDVLFLSQEAGPISVDEGTVNKIIQIIQGVDSVTNPDEGIPGSVAETDAELRYRRLQQLANNSANTFGSLLPALYAIDEVSKARVYENFDKDDTKPDANGIIIKTHSILVVVFGPNFIGNLNDPVVIAAKQKVAKAMYQHKSPGCDMNGDVNVTYVPVDMPWCSFEALFYIAKKVDIYIAIEFVDQKANNLDTDALTQKVSDILIADVTGDNIKGSGIQIGDNFTSERFLIALYRNGIAGINSLLIDRSSPANSNSVQLQKTEVPILSKEHITIGFSKVS